MYVIIYNLFSLFTCSFLLFYSDALLICIFPLSFLLYSPSLAPSLSDSRSFLSSPSLSSMIKRGRRDTRFIFFSLSLFLSLSIKLAFYPCMFLAVSTKSSCPPLSHSIYRAMIIFWGKNTINILQFVTEMCSNNTCNQNNNCQTQNISRKMFYVLFLRCGREYLTGIVENFLRIRDRSSSVAFYLSLFFDYLYREYLSALFT